MAKQYSYGICPYIIINGSFFILLNKTSKNSSFNFFKGKIRDGETKEQAAIREFYEEAGVKITEEDLEERFSQKNSKKNIGIYLVDFTKYNHMPFKFQKREIYSAMWINVSKEVEMSKNQKKIFSDIILHFKSKKVIQNIKDVNVCLY
jgi:8-oxo-dGTP pyrophosphatase MutT (NUDIX family)